MLRQAGIIAATVAVLVNGALAQERSSQDGPRALVAAYNASGVALFKEFSFKPGNIVFSPYSIGTAMAMVLAGARGSTESEMASVLKQNLTPAQIADANQAVRATLSGYDKSGASPQCRGGLKFNGKRCEGAPDANGYCPVPGGREGALCVGPPLMPPSASLLIANALMLTGNGDLVSSDYATLLKEKYGADIFKNAALDDINGWVKSRTQGKIDRIVDKLDPKTIAAVLNAVYFRANWATRFAKEQTKDERFNPSRQKSANVPTMHLQAHLAVATRAGYRAIRLPYEIGTLAMIVLLPSEIDGAAKLVQRLDANEWAEVAGILRAPASIKLVDLTLPRFKTEFRADLVSSFSKQGMRRAFDGKFADFGGISGRPPSQVPLFISAIAHRAVIDVMEAGTEAAAATGVVMAVSAVRRPEEPVTFRVDHPFLFALVDDESGAILFQGRIADPR